MKKTFLAILVAVSLNSAFAQTIQTYNIDSLKKVLSYDLADTSRIWAFNNLGRNIPDSDTTLLLAEQAIALSQKIGFAKGEAEAYNNKGYWYNQKGNYPLALQNYLKAIQLAESVTFLQGLKRSYNSISTVYLYMKDYTTSISYARKARDLSLQLQDQHTLSLANAWLSSGYIHLHQNDSALKFAHESYTVASGLNQLFPLYLATARLGEIYALIGNSTLALAYFQRSLQYSKRDGRSFRIASAHQELANEFQRLGVKDSSLFHAQKTFSISQSENLQATLMSSCLTLSEWHEGYNDNESLRYYKLAMIAQDSLFNQEKSRQVESLSINETLRQRSIEAQKIKAEEDRRHNLQYAGIAVGLVILVLIFLLLSHSIRVTERPIKFLGVLALLIVFEFVNLLMHPLLGSITHHSPLLMLMLMVCVAAILIPFHHKLEQWIVHRLVEKNKKIRQAANTKKIIRHQEEAKD